MPQPVEMAVVVGKMKGGGVEATVLSYVKHIRRENIHFTLLVDEDSTVVPEALISSYGADLIYIPPYQHLITYHRKLVEILRAKHYDAVHTHLTTLSVFPLFAAKCAGIPVRIVHAHSTAGKGEWKRSLAKYLLRPFSKVFATDLCACSEYAGKWLFGKRANFTALPNAIDFESEQYRFSMKTRKELRVQLCLGDAVVIGHAGRFIPKKNHDFLLDVFSCFLSHIPNAELLLIGEGELLQAMQEKATRLGINEHVVFLGQRDDVCKLYQTMDILLFPSLSEGLALVPMEAQMSGLPALIADNITRELVFDGSLVHFASLSESAECWASRLLELLPHCDAKHRKSPDGPLNDNAIDNLEHFYINAISRRRSDTPNRGL